MNRRFALVDRDGTINVERNHITDPEQIELIPGSAEALVRLREQVGMGIVIVTNQAHVGRGELSPEDLDRIHERLLELLAERARRSTRSCTVPMRRTPDAPVGSPRRGSRSKRRTDSGSTRRRAS